MIMTEEQICREYKEAKHPSEHISVLADMNLCKRSDITDILVRNGLMSAPKPVETKTTAPKKPARQKVKVEEASKDLPKEVCAALEKAMAEIEAEIKELEGQYKIIASFLWNGGSANG